MDQNIESKILEKRKLCKVLKVFKIVSFIGIFAPFVAFMVVSRNGYELDSAWLLIPALLELLCWLTAQLPLVLLALVGLFCLARPRHFF